MDIHMTTLSTWDIRCWYFEESPFLSSISRGRVDTQMESVTIVIRVQIFKEAAYNPTISVEFKICLIMIRSICEYRESIRVEMKNGRQPFKSKAIVLFVAVILFLHRARKIGTRMQASRKY